MRKVQPVLQPGAVFHGSVTELDALKPRFKCWPKGIAEGSDGENDASNLQCMHEWIANLVWGQLRHVDNMTCLKHQNLELQLP